MAPALASADTTYCVPTASIVGCSAGATPKTTVADALSAIDAHSASAHDRLLIGAGTFNEGSLSDGSGHRVDIVGAGQGQTVIQPASASGVITLTVSEPSSTVSGLTVGVAAGSGSIGLYSAGAADRVTVSGGSASTGDVGVFVPGGGPSGSFAAGTIDLADAGSVGIDVTAGNKFAVSDTTIVAGTGFQGSGTISRSRITATTGVSVGTVLASSLVIEDSLVVTVPGLGSETAISAPASALFVAASTDVTAQHDTLIGDGSSGSVGVLCTAKGGGGSDGSCTATVDSSVIRGFVHAIERSATANGAQAAANVTVNYSDLDPGTNLESGNTAGVPAGGASTGQITLGAHDVNLDPAFASTTVGAAAAFQLSRVSPVIDKGDPVPGTSPAESSIDLTGNPRAVAGAAAAGAVSDIGAFEYQPQAPTVSVTATPMQTVTGTPTNLTAATSDLDPTDTVSVSWRFDDGATASGSSVSHTFATAGTHSATATATDLGGFTATAVATVTVASPGGVRMASPAPERPVVAGLTLRPKTFVAATSDRALVSASGSKRGTLVSYRDSQPAASRLTVLRATPGVRKGRSCAQPSRRRSKHLKRCKRWVAVGAFGHADGGGMVSFRFSGRTGGHALTPGGYRLRLVARDVAGVSNSMTVAFSVRTPRRSHPRR